MGSSSGSNTDLTPAEGLPRHVAIIMDGNGRWAKSRFLPRAEGHRNGAKAVRLIVEESRRLGIKYLTLFSFSTENWLRPQEEVSALMKLFTAYLESEKEIFLRNDIRLRAIGDMARLPENVRTLLTSVTEATKHCKSLDLVLAISYGGREEIVSSARRLAHQVARGELRPEDINEALFAASLYGPEIPDPDLLIRTSDEFRISNFLLWQLAYSEIVVTPVLWPDFSVGEYHRCLAEYRNRERRFGLTDEQLERNGVRES